jgi:hypothetical protein
VFTSRDDNTVGETISGSSGTPAIGNATYLLVTAGNNPVKYLRFNYAGTALFQVNTARPIWHCQFVKCNTAVLYIGASVAQEMHNVLLSQCSVGLYGYGNCVGLAGEHVTADQVNQLIVNGCYYYPARVLTNSLLTAVTNLGIYVSFVNTRQFSSGAGIYTNVGAGNYYLVDNSTNRNAGVTNISAALLAEIKKKTTYPPVVYANTNFTSDTTLSPQAGRDTDAPDLGYHYDPLDYVVSGVGVSANLTLTNGVALGIYGSSASYGLGLNSGSLVSEGTPIQLNWIVRYNTVQEQSASAWSASSAGPSVKVLSTAPQVRARFTGWSVPGGSDYHLQNYYQSTSLQTFSHSEFSGGQFSLGGSLALTNCLWQRVKVSLFSDQMDDAQWHLQNNLFFGGWLTYTPGNPETQLLLAYDNLFDRTLISKSLGDFPYPADFVADYNGYISGQNRISPNGAHDVLMAGTVYAAGPLGPWYQAVTNLINAGSTNAFAASLYYYTTQTNQTREANSTVDIGYHFVAADANGNPFDFDGDGIPDYLDPDADGDGVSDAAEYLLGRNLLGAGTTGDSGNLTKLIRYTPLQ